MPFEIQSLFAIASMILLASTVLLFVTYQNQKAVIKDLFAFIIGLFAFEE